MGKPYDHAVTSAKQFGGKPEDYIDIHNCMDSSRKAFTDLRHRTLTHNSWFITEILPYIFGETRTNSDNRVYSVKDIGEQHVLEDYGGFIPTVQDFLVSMKKQPWMDNGQHGALPPSARETEEPAPPYQPPLGGIRHECEGQMVLDRRY